MTSNSHFDYKVLASALIGRVLQKRDMYFRTLPEIEAMMYGHWFAYYESWSIDRGSSFNTCFARWLEKHKGMPSDAGWAYVVVDYAKSDGLDAEKMFGTYASEFLAEWSRNADNIETGP